MRTNITDSTGNLSPRSLGYKSKTNSSVQMYATSITGINYLVAGKQKQWGYVSKSAVSGSAAFTLPVSATILAAASMLKSNQNDSVQLGWHGIGTWSTTQINVTWNTYEGRSAVNAVGYIAVSKVQEQWGEATLNSAKTLPISFSQAAYCAVGTPQGAANTDNTTYYKIDVNSVYFSNYGYNGKCYFIVVGL